MIFKVKSKFQSAAILGSFVAVCPGDSYPSKTKLRRTETSLTFSNGQKCDILFFWRIMLCIISVSSCCHKMSIRKLAYVKTKLHIRCRFMWKIERSSWSAHLACMRYDLLLDLTYRNSIIIIVTIFHFLRRFTLS